MVPPELIGAMCWPIVEGVGLDPETDVMGEGNYIPLQGVRGGLCLGGNI